MEKKLVSVIVPVYNVENYIYKCVNSITNQTYRNLEIILVNDGSKDNSGKLCDELACNDNRIKVIHENNNGVSISRNIGINTALGDYILFVDSDDYLDKNVIEELVKNLSGCDIVKISHKEIRGNKEKNFSNEGVYTKKEYIKKILFGDIGGHSWGYLLKRDIIKEIYFDTNTSCMEDTIFILNCILKSNNIKCINTSYYNYRINETGITCSSERIFRNIEDYMYSMDKIENMVKVIRNKNFHSNMLIKRLKLIECEVAKINSVQEIQILFDNEDINKILRAIDEKASINIIYKLFIYFIINKKYNLILIYLKIRRLLKNIVNSIR